VISPSRVALRFVQQAQAAFEFVTRAPFGLRLEEADTLRVRYEGNGIVLVIDHDRLSYEVDVAITRSSLSTEMSNAYSMLDLLRVSDAQTAKRYRCPAGSTPESVHVTLSRLADVLRVSGRSALLNVDGHFEKVSRARDEATVRFGREEVRRQARSHAEKAWDRREWLRVARALGSIEADLSPAELKKLRYARRRLRLAEDATE
jgi:hypothetical protein